MKYLNDWHIIPKILVFSQFFLEIFIDFYFFTKAGNTLQIFITILDFLHSFRIALINLCCVVLSVLRENQFHTYFLNFKLRESAIILFENNK